LTTKRRAVNAQGSAAIHVGQAREAVRPTVHPPLGRNDDVKMRAVENEGRNEKTKKQTATSVL
jgi:hypothetical protein